MNLLPRSHKDFGTASYWEEFFKKRGQKAFEWYGEYLELCGILHKYVKPADNILVIGCGNSTLSADLYDVGHHKITNIDISDVVIRQMNDKYSKDKPEMKFMKMDMLKMDFSDSEFSVVLDKGTLDAVMTDDSDSTIATVEKMFSEISRVLRVGGRYVCISLAQEHIIKKVLQHFSSLGWPIRICRVEDTEDEEPREFHMPVFAFVLTKFKKMPNMKQILEVSYFNEKVKRLDDSNSVLDAIKELQHYGVVRQQLNKSSVDGEHLSVHLYSPDNNIPRYTLHIVDSKISTGNKFAIFIVPEGRELEWMFQTDEGRRQLSESAGFERLVVVTLHKEHFYHDLEAIKADLSSKVMELAPPKLGNKKVPFLSLGDDIKQREILHRGESEMSGKFVVEDVITDGEPRRQLVFMVNVNAVQSSAKLDKEDAEKEGKTTADCKIDFTFLSCLHHSISVAGMAFLENFDKSMENQINACIIGLGGGGLAMFLHTLFPKMHIDAVEIDPTMVDIATKWFGFKKDERMKVHVCDGIKFLEDRAKEGPEKQYDVIFLDPDSKEISQGLGAPPEPFVTPSFLSTMHSLLTPRGVMVLNLVCRDEKLRSAVEQKINNEFKRVFVCKVPEEVNREVFALPNARTTDVTLTGDSKIPDTIINNLKSLKSIINSGRSQADILPTLESHLNGLRQL